MNALVSAESIFIVGEMLVVTIISHLNNALFKSERRDEWDGSDRIEQESNADYGLLTGADG